MPFQLTATCYCISLYFTVTSRQDGDHQNKTNLITVLKEKIWRKHKYRYNYTHWI